MPEVVLGLPGREAPWFPEGEWDRLDQQNPFPYLSWSGLGVGSPPSIKIEKGLISAFSLDNRGRGQQQKLKV